MRVVEITAKDKKEARQKWEADKWTEKDEADFTTSPDEIEDIEEKQE